MTKFLYRLGFNSARHPFRVLLIWLLVAVAAFALKGSVGGETNDDFTIPGTESQAAFDLLEDRFPAESSISSRVVFHHERGLDGPERQAAVEATLAELREAPHVIEVTNPYDPRGPTLSPDGTVGFADVTYDLDDTLPIAQFDQADAAAELSRDAGIAVEFGGSLGVAGAEEAGGGELVGIGVAVIVLLVAFGSVIAMGIPIGTALFGVLIGMSLLGVLAGATDVPSVSPMIATMIGLGVGIDYALFVVTRHRELLHEGHSVPDAAGRANATAGQAVLFAGVTVVVAICGLWVSGIPAIATMGWASGIVVVVSMLLAVTMLPALLGWAGTGIDKLRLPSRRRRKAVAAVPAKENTSTRWAHHVAERPWRYTIGTLVLLVALAAPLTQLHIGFPDDSNQPEDTTTRQAYDLLADGFGAGFNSTVNVVVDLTGSEDDAAVIGSVESALAADPGVVAVGPPAVNESGDTAVFSATPATAPQDADTDDMIDRLRDVAVPAAVEGSGADAYVAGDAAAMRDISNKLMERLPLFIAAVVLVSFLLLVVVFRSLLVPAKAALMNLLSIGASYGVVVAVFQWGWGSGLIGVHESIPISPFVPMIMFAILFGLSMDYEVFLLTRVRESFLEHGDNRRSVIEGLGSTARVITSSALIMISVFGAFVLSPEVEMKVFGLGLATAIFVDATLVRMVLVPATMSLIGKANWWVPGWLDRILPHLDFEGGAPESAPALPEVVEVEEEVEPVAA
jgi:RND superfamily putative drug exporter